MPFEQNKEYIAKETEKGICVCPVCNMAHMKKETTPVICPCCGTRLYYDIEEWIKRNNISQAELESLITSAAEGFESILDISLDSRGYDRQYTGYLKEALKNHKKA